MGKILISAFIAFAVVAVLLIPNRSADEILVEKALMATCSHSAPSPQRGIGLTAEQHQQVCGCGVAAVMKHLAPDLGSLVQLLQSGRDIDRGTQVLLARQFDACLAQHQIPVP